MKPLQKISILKMISRNLEMRGLSLDNVYLYLREYDPSVCNPFNDSWDSISQYVENVCGYLDNQVISSIYEELTGKEVTTVIDIDYSSIWKPGYYRLFISHLTENKQSISNLKVFLAKYGIDCFVAHEDIAPTKLWLKEIKKALMSADALCAVFSPHFNESNWCDQEVGFALGRNIPIISINKGVDPHGLVSEFQAIPSKTSSSELAKDVYNAICSMDDSCPRLYHVLTRLLIDSSNIDEANQWLNLITISKSYPEYEIEDLYNSYKSNPLLITEEVLTRLNTLFKRINRRAAKPQPMEELDLPF